MSNVIKVLAVIVFVFGTIVTDTPVTSPKTALPSFPQAEASSESLKHH
ncbi:hypothetical protein [Butyrivibrio sp. NC3005]|nr:hypothetical protein [Butyrivibrio sp. NC3005]